MSIDPLPLFCNLLGSAWYHERSDLRIRTFIESIVPYSLLKSVFFRLCPPALVFSIRGERNLSFFRVLGRRRSTDLKKEGKDWNERRKERTEFEQLLYLQRMQEKNEKRSKLTLSVSVIRSSSLSLLLLLLHGSWVVVSLTDRCRTSSPRFFSSMIWRFRARHRCCLKRAAALFLASRSTGDSFGVSALDPIVNKSWLSLTILSVKFSRWCYDKLGWSQQPFTSFTSVYGVKYNTRNWILWQQSIGRPCKGDMTKQDYLARIFYYLGRAVSQNSLSVSI